MIRVPWEVAIAPKADGLRISRVRKEPMCQIPFVATGAAAINPTMAGGGFLPTMENWQMVGMVCDWLDHIISDTSTSSWATKQRCQFHVD